MTEQFRFDGWETLHDSAQETGMGSLGTGTYDEDTDTITIYLDMLVDGIFGDFWFGRLKRKHIDILTQNLCDMLTHEYVHAVLKNFVSSESCRAFDNIKRSLSQ